MDDQERRFNRILKGHSTKIATLAKSLRELVRAAVPELREIVKDGYAIYGTTGYAFAITLHRDHVNLQFYFGTSLSDPEGLLVGEGKRMRHIAIRSPEDLRADYLSRLVRQAVEYDSPAKFK